MKKTISLLLALLFLGFLGQAANACSCTVSSKKEKIDYAKWLKGFEGAAFTGKVEKFEVDKENMRAKVTFAVRSYWTGVEGTEVVIQTPGDSGMCGVYYEEGKDYTVIADRSEEGLWVYLCSQLRYSTYREGFLKALGQPKVFSDPEGEGPRKFDEFGNPNCNDELARLDAFANELQNEPAGVGYLIAYGGKRGKHREAAARLARMSYYLKDVRGIDPGSLITVDGGFRENLTVELWLWQPGNSAPTASPTVNSKDVRFKGKEKVRGYNCADEMGS